MFLKNFLGGAKDENLLKFYVPMSRLVANKVLLDFQTLNIWLDLH